MSLNQRLALAAVFPAFAFMPQANLSFPSKQSLKAADFIYRDNGSDEQTIITEGATIDVLKLEISGKVTAAADAPVGPCEAGFAGIIESIELRANDLDTVVDMTPFSALILQRSRDQVVLDDDNALGVDTAEYSTVLTIDMRQLMTQTPTVSGIDMRVLRAFKMKLNYAGANGLYLNSNGATLSDVTIRASYEGVRDSNVPANFPVPEYIDTYTEIDRDKADFIAYELEGQPADTPLSKTKWIKGVWLVGRQLKKAMADVFDPAVPVHVRIGTTTVWNGTLADLRALNKRYHNDYLGSAIYVPLLVNGDLSSAIPLPSFAGKKLTVELGVKNTAPGELDVLALPDVVRFFDLS